MRYLQPRPLMRYLQPRPLIFMIGAMFPVHAMRYETWLNILVSCTVTVEIHYFFKLKEPLSVLRYSHAEPSVNLVY